jgi:hypothetical protein
MEPRNRNTRNFDEVNTENEVEGLKQTGRGAQWARCALSAEPLRVYRRPTPGSTGRTSAPGCPVTSVSLGIHPRDHKTVYVVPLGYWRFMPEGKAPSGAVARRR